MKDLIRRKSARHTEYYSKNIEGKSKFSNVNQ